MESYDHISYRKGAKFLWQMDKYVGREIMKDGIKTYFANFKYEAVGLKEFVGCIEEAVHKKERNIDIVAWVDSWLTKAGVNEVKASIEHKENSTYAVHLH